MNRGLVAAWALGLGVLTWRELARWKRPVPAGRYAAASGVFLALGLLAQSEAAAPAATLAAWGFDLAIILRPGFLPGTGPAGSAPVTGTTQAPGTTTAGGRG